MELIYPHEGERDEELAKILKGYHLYVQLILYLAINLNAKLRITNDVFTSGLYFIN